MSPNAPFLASRTRPCGGGGRSRLPRTRTARPAAPAAHEPDPAQLPDLSPETLQRLDALTPLQAAMVLWRAAGYSATESYRKAAGKDSESARQSAHQVFSRPDVSAALAAALHDRNFTAVFDRGWMITRLAQVVNECAEMRTPAAGGTLINALVTMAKLQGEWPMGRSGRRLLPPPPPQPAGNSQAMKRVDEILAEVDRRAAAARAAAKAQSGSSAFGTDSAAVILPAETTPVPSNRRLDQPVADAGAISTRSLPRPAVVDPRAVAPSAIPVAADASQPSATPAVAPDEDTSSSGSTKYVFTPRLAEDGKPIGEVRPFRGLGLIQRPQIAEPPPAGPVLPRVGSVRYGNPWEPFMGTYG